MQAILIRQPGDATQLYLGEYERPKPAPDEVLVRVAATALNRADILQREGKYPPPAGASPILGLEVAGEVAAIGSQVSQFSPGDRVFGLLPGGAYAQYATIKASMALPIPQNWSFEEAAAIPEVFLTAYQALMWLAKLQAEETILIHAGASGVGTAAIQLAKLIGAKVAVTASAAKHEACRQLGADLCIDYHHQDFVYEIRQHLRPSGVDVVLDFMAAAYFEHNLQVLNTDGRLVMLALLGGHRLGETNLAPILSKRLSILGSTLRSRSLSYQSQLTTDFWRFCAKAFAQGQLRPVIDSVYPWQQVQEAHQRMEQNLNVGKIILKVAH
jgi:putative PIG3 family NAD(P)H quinone oxidoreductase